MKFRGHVTEQLLQKQRDAAARSTSVRLHKRIAALDGAAAEQREGAFDDCTIHKLEKHTHKTKIGTEGGRRPSSAPLSADLVWSLNLCSCEWTVRSRLTPL